MLAIDTNVLLPAVETSNHNHAQAADFLRMLQAETDVAISELVLIELYGLLRNPQVLAKPASARTAAAICQEFRRHPRWQLLGLPPAGRAFHDELWGHLHDEATPRRRIFDLRLGLSLLRQGVTRFATVNVKDFQTIGFEEVWNPLGKH
jgi:predicted nucleic acid-binding protein